VCFERYEYDVCLGGQNAERVAADHELKPMWVTLCQKRIDVVGWTGTKATLIEVKPVAGFSALGQIIGYGWLWNKEKVASSFPSLLVVCEFLDADLAGVFAELAVRVLVVPPP